MCRSPPRPDSRAALPALAAYVALLVAALAPAGAGAQTPAPSGAQTPAPSGAKTPTPPAETAGPRQKLAVLLVHTDEVPEELADNLTEVLIAALARRPESFDIVGREEFKAKLRLEGQRAASCLNDVACLGRVGVTLGASRIISGTVGRRGDAHLYNLNLVDLGSGRVVARVFQLVGGEVPKLVASVQAAAGKLFERARPPGALRVAGAARGAQVFLDDEFMGFGPARRENLEPGRHTLRVVKAGRIPWQKEVEVPSGAQLEIALDDANLPRRRRWPRVLAWTSLGVAGAAGIAGMLFGILSQEDPSAALGRQATRDFLEARRNQATLANVFLGVAGAAALTSALTFGLHWNEITGGDDAGGGSSPGGRGDARPSAPTRTRAGLLPLRGGALLQGGWRW